MPTQQIRVHRSLIWHRRAAAVLAALGLALATVGVFLGLATPYAIALAAMGASCLVATVPLFSRASTLQRQLIQIEVHAERARCLRPALLPTAATLVPPVFP